ncbi:MAG TPA: methyltransferase domain-containing protein [Gaiellaceae bacterium]|nr:methyltransferase domain-containing protein [Gaiellaceae bacterium]
MRAHAFMLVKRALYPGTDVALRQRLQLVRHFRPGPVATLDVGCGNGAFALAAYRLGNEVLGIDSNPENIRRCREYASYVGVDEARCRFAVGNVHTLEDLGERFDQIVAFELLEHLAHADEAVHRLAHLLANGGILHLSTPYLHRRAFYGEVLSDVEDGGHLRLGYTQYQLCTMLTSAGLEPTQTDAVVGPWSRHSLELVNRVQDRLGRAGAVAALAATAPIRLLDAWSSGPRLIVYARGQKP